MKYALAIALTLVAGTAQAQQADRASPMLPPAAKPHVGVLPPVEFDRPYTGKLKMIRGDAFLMSKLCPKTPFPITLGCAYSSPDKSECVVIMAEDGIIYDAGWTRELVWRHERAHCLNWGNDHKGARPVTPELLSQR
jgi:hypothetical protein